MDCKRRMREKAYTNPRLFYLMHMSSVSPLVWRDIVRWKKAGKPSPAPAVVKRRTMWSYAKKSGLKILVETGTHRGDTVAALMNKFEHIYSIELSGALYEEARERFKGADHVHLICGDSSVELGSIVQGLDQPALFWLDGHWCGGRTAKGAKVTPIYEELGHILEAAGRGHVILVDDARLFGLDEGYPSLEELQEFVMWKRPDVRFSVKDDIVRIAPAES